MHGGGCVPAGEDTAADGALPILHASPLGASEQAVDIHKIAGRVSEHSERASICTDSDTVLLRCGSSGRLQRDDRLRPVHPDRRREGWEHKAVPTPGSLCWNIIAQVTP